VFIARGSAGPGLQSTSNWFMATFFGGKLDTKRKVDRGTVSKITITISNNKQYNHY
jgi:hypothetical protein